MGIHLLLSLGILNGKLGALRKALGKDDHGAPGADGMREAVDRLGPAGQMDKNGHAKKNALRAATFFIGLRTNGIGTALDLRRGRSGVCV